MDKGRTDFSHSFSLSFREDSLSLDLQPKFPAHLPSVPGCQKKVGDAVVAMKKVVDKKIYSNSSIRPVKTLSFLLDI